MSIKYIKKLSMNPHFYGLLLQGFLTGYNKPCEVKFAFMSLPILLYSESRKKLIKANSRSRIETLFNKSEDLDDDVKISGKVNLSGYIKRFDELVAPCKKALIILYSQKKIMINKNKIIILEPIKYSDYNDGIKYWIRAAHYLGIIFSKTNEDNLNYFLGVDWK